MTKEKFISKMEEIKELYEKREEFLISLANLFGGYAEERIYDFDFLPILLNSIEEEIIGSSQEGWLTYIVYDCYFDLDEAIVEANCYNCEWNDWGDFYDFLVSRRDIYV